jgi:hypothetical protein
MPAMSTFVCFTALFREVEPAARAQCRALGEHNRPRTIVLNMFEPPNLAGFDCDDRQGCRACLGVIRWLRRSPLHSAA